jgi:DNA-binding NarL/FixJ family response regulator
MPTRPRVLLADDHPGVTKALSRFLSLDCDVVGIVADGSDVAAAAARLQPVVTVVDVHLPSVNGWDVCAQILHTDPHAKVILISASFDDEIRVRALAAGASGFFPKLMAGNELIEAIRGAWAEIADDSRIVNRSRAQEST